MCIASLGKCIWAWLERWVAAVSGVLGGSWVVISMVISPLIWLIIYNYSYPTYTPFKIITTHEPPSKDCIEHQVEHQIC